MALRLLSVSALLLFGLAVHADYTIVLEKGDTIVSKRAIRHGMTLELSTGDLPLGDVVFVEHVVGHNLERWAYRFSTGDKMSLPLCKNTTTTYACAYAAKYGSEKALGEFPMVKQDWASDPLFIAYYRTALLDQWIRTDMQGRPLPHDTIRPFKSDELSVILRNGDTLTIGKNNFFMKKDTLCWFGGGRLHKNQVLLLRSKKGVQVILDMYDKIVDFDAPIPDLSPASRGVVYAHINSPRVTVADLSPRDLADAPVILAASDLEYDLILARLLNKSATLNGARTGFIVAKDLLMLMH